MTWPRFLDLVAGLSAQSRFLPILAAAQQQAESRARVEGASWEELQAMAAVEVPGYEAAWRWRED